MTEAARLALPAAMLLAMAGAFFGVVMARFIWAEDLENAKRIDAIRSQTEQHLRDQIKAREQTEQAMRRQIEILEGRK